VLDSLVDPVFTVILLSSFTFTNKYHVQPTVGTSLRFACYPRKGEAQAMTLNYCNEINCIHDELIGLGPGARTRGFW